MPVLDADALKADPAGMAFLRSVIEPASGADRPAEALPESAQRLRAAAERSRRGGVADVRGRRVRAQVRV